MIKKCLICKKKFKTYLCLIKKGYGKYCSHKCYIEAAKQGKYPKRGYQKGHSQFNSGKTHFKKGHIPWIKGKHPVAWNKGKKFPQISGKNHHNWKNGISTENDRIRHSLEMKQWERNVFKRDNRTCRKCKKKNKPAAHHIFNFSQYPELRFAIDNGLTFCVKCHTLFHQTYGYKNNNKEQIDKFLSR